MTSRRVRQALAQEPANLEAMMRLGADAHAAGNGGAALAWFQRVARLQPWHRGALYNLALLALQRRQPRQALPLLARLLSGEPANAPALLLLARAQQDDGQAAAAERALRRARRLRPGDANVAKRLGALLMSGGRRAEAAQVFRAALTAAPDDPELWFNLSVTLDPRDRGGAIAAIRRAVRLQPEAVPPLRRLADLLAKTKSKDAVPVLERLVARSPDAWSLALLGGLYKGEGRRDKAVAMFGRAAALAPGLTSEGLGLCMARLPQVYRSADEIARVRAEYRADLERLAAADLSDPAALERAAQAVGTFQSYYLPYQAECDLEPQVIYGRMMHRAMAARHPQWSAPLPPRRRAPGERLRVGIVSGFFRWHTIWKLFLRGWMAGLDRARLDITAYSTTPVNDHVTALARQGFERFAEDRTAEALAARILADRPDVLLYPEIGMDALVMRLACLRLAPVQCVSWGHPNTSGLPTMDWFLTSDLMEPPGGEACYSERVHRLPGLGIAYGELEAPLTATDFAPWGIRPDAVLYLCCQYLPKYLPQHDALLARIARRVPAAQFAFISLRKPALDQIMRARLTAAFAAEGLDAGRHVVFLPYLQPGQYAALNQRADIYLDTIGWSGGNTTLEAVAAGLPVVTLPGALMRGRHSAAILHRIGVTETIARDEDDYAALAVRLAEDAAWRQDVSRRVAAGQGNIYGDAEPLRALEAFLETVSPPAG